MDFKIEFCAQEECAPQRCGLSMVRPLLHSISSVGIFIVHDSIVSESHPLQREEGIKNFQILEDHQGS
jgi:hypothetical protein